MITGTKIGFQYQPVQHRPPATREFSVRDSLIIAAEIEKLLTKGMIIRKWRLYFSHFSERKGRWIMILNLKALNKRIAITISK